MGRRKWYNDLARDTRDIQYLRRVYGAKTEEERARRAGCLEKVVIAVILLLCVCLLIPLLSALFSGCSPKQAAVRPTATPEMLIVRPTKAPPTEIPYNISVTMTVEALDREYFNMALKWTAEATPQYHEPKNIYPPTEQPCLNIKGNASANNGDRIYHCPGWRDYDRIVINYSEGDRMFCSEAEARAAGFREPEYSHGACR